jgi:glycosyltransferase involved in cell wall biosynthesis
VPISGIKVLTIGKAFAIPYETRHIDESAQILPAIARFRPDVIVTSTFLPGVLQTIAFEIRKRWLHVEPDTPLESLCSSIEGCYARNIFHPHPNETHQPLLSVFTGTFNTGCHLLDAYRSLTDQSYPNWEWVVVDDQSEDGTWERLLAIAADDTRVRAFRSASRLSKIGAVKDLATRLAKGAFLVELDHDDMLTDFALAEIKAAFAEDPDVGFVYSNSSSFFEDGTFQRFRDAFWQPRYRWTEYRGRKWLECLQPDIYDRFGASPWDQFAWFLTVGPNHVRAFRAKTFFELGGYNSNLLVADDWDLSARFFLRSRCKLIAKMLYLYRFKDNWSNTTFRRNEAIQDHLELARAFYREEFEAFNRSRLPSGERPSTQREERPCFVVASRSEEDAKGIRALLKGQDLFVRVGARSILKVYEEGRQHWSARRRLIYLHDDVRFADLEGFLAMIETLPPGLHGPCGSQAAGALGGSSWSESPPLAGSYEQHFPDGTPPKKVRFSDAATEVSWLDGFCLVAVDQEWSWLLPGDPEVWHSYDWLACTRTAAAGGRCFTFPSGQILLAHRGYMRTAGLDETLRLVRSLTGAAQTEARELPNLSVVVLEATATELTARCLQSIRVFAPGAEIILVANGLSPSPAAFSLADQVLQLSANLGFAAGCNAGAAKATRSNLCFMNNDASFVDATPAQLVAAMTHLHPIVGPYSNYAKPPQGNFSHSSVPGEDLFPEMLVGLCLLMPLALYWEIGGFDPRLLTYEDDDFCLRARRAGRHCKVVGGTWVQHEGSATFQALHLDLNIVMSRNRTLFEKKKKVIRVIAIARDEEASIAGFFKQFASVTDDWCLLDSGSTDATREIAIALGARVLTTEFSDFASARNEALDRFAMGAEWVLMLDPDERLDLQTIGQIRALVHGARHEIFLSPLFSLYPEGRRQEFVPKPFLFRHRPEIRWIFKVHEKLIGSERQALVENAEIVHALAFHGEDRRHAAELRYQALMQAEPYFADPAYQTRFRSQWPVLDYQRRDDPRIEKIFGGPLISVIIPTFRRSALLSKAVASVSRQSYANVEIIVVGDACPDLDPSAFADQPAIRCYNLQTNHGAGGAAPRNHGIYAAAGEWIAYLDDDNEWAPDHLASLWESARQASASFAFSSMQVDGRDLGFTTPKLQGIDTSGLLHRRALIRRHGEWKDRAEAGYAHDWELISRWVSAGERWVCTRRPTLIYNASTSGQSEHLRSRAMELPEAVAES